MEETPIQTKFERGSSPGTLLFTGRKKVERVKISIFNYSESAFEEKEVTNLNDLNLFKSDNKVTWINVTGLHDVEVIEKIGKIFNIHALVLEDILNVNHSPKLDNYDEYLFAIVRMIDLNKINALNIEQVSFILHQNYLITFQEDEEDLFNIIRDRIRKNIGRVRKQGADYLMYRLIDAMVDNLSLIIENFNDRVNSLEDKILLQPNKISINSIYTLRKEINTFRSTILPLADLVYALSKERDRHLHKTTYYFLRDLNDHLKQVIETTENFRETISNMIDLYLSSVSFKMNEIIKVLTLVSSIFIPLTFIVGIYGMNFNTSKPGNMPELNWSYGYVLVMFFMTILSLTILYFFRRKKWL